MSSLSIRKATPSDLSHIAKLIRDLAEYEKLLDEVTFDESRLHDELFGDAPVAFVWMAEWGDEPVGLALCFYNFSTFLGKRGIYIEDLFVDPDYRGKNIGKALMQKVAKQAIAEDCGRVEWQVLDWNQPSIDFYEKMNARNKSEWLTYQLTGDALKSLAESA